MSLIYSPASELAVTGGPSNGRLPLAGDEALVPVGVGAWQI